MSAPLRRVWLTLIGLHILLLAYALPIGVILGDSPLGGPDYQTHFQHTHTLLQVQAEFGRAWAYDPNLLAGHPTGLIFDVDNKLHFGWTSMLVRLGVPLPTAFNLFAWLACALAPVSLWLAARLLRMEVGARALAFGLGVLVWSFDPTARFCWAGGMISFAFAAHVSTVVIAVMHRLLADGGRRLAVALLVLLPLVLRMHVWSFAILVVPLTGMYLRAWRQIPARRHAVVWGAALLGLLVNLDWLLPALAHRDLIVPSARLGQATPPYLLFDYLELLVDPLRTGFVMQRTLLRALVVIAAVGTLWSWRGDARRFTGGLTLAWLLGLTYAGALVPGVQATEPYRFAVPLVLWATVLAGTWLLRAVEGLRGLQGAARGAVLGLLILVLPRLYHQLMPYLTMLSPGPAPTGHAARSLPSARLEGVPADFEAVATWLEGQPRGGRVLVQYHPLGEYLRWASDWPVLGGFYDRRMIFQDANLFYFAAGDDRYRDGLAAYLERYNVSHLVMTYPYVAEVERRTDLFEPAGIQGGVHRVYTVRKRGSYFVEGVGEVQAGLNRIAVRAARPAPGSQALTLRFHYMDELRCAPGCRVERAEVEGDTAGFVRVVGEPVLPAEFVVSLEY
ncbi:MAG TPA: hypothetical protein VGB85_29340 [Nannocystis sp.]